jgi:hypothetical protein
MFLQPRQEETGHLLDIQPKQSLCKLKTLAPPREGRNPKPQEDQLINNAAGLLLLETLEYHEMPLLGRPHPLI